MRIKFWLCVCMLLGVTQTVLAQSKPLVLLTFDYPPFIVQDAKAPTGMMIEVVSEAFKRAGKPIKFEFYPLPRGLQMLEAGEGDALFTLKKTPEREAKFVFSQEPVLAQDYVFFVPKDSNIAFNGDLKTMSNATIGVVSKVSFGSVFDKAAEAGVFKKLDVAQTYETNFKKLLAKRTDAVVCSRVVGLTILKGLNASQEAKVSGPPIETAQSYIMFNKKVGADVVAAFDKAIAAMRKDGTYAKIEKKYSE